MKIIIDSNVLISASVLKSDAIKKFMNCVLTKHHLILTDSIINETRCVISRKWADKLEFFDDWLSSIGYEYGTAGVYSEDFVIRDLKDRHVIISAYNLQADVLVTGDKDFFEHSYAVEVLTPSGFLAKYGDPVTTN